MITKKQLRKEVLQVRDSLTILERKEKSDSIAKQVSSRKEFLEADQYLLFASFRSEVDTSYLLSQALETHKPVYLPKVLGKEMKFYQIESLHELEQGYQGIPAPREETHREFVPIRDQKIFVLIPGAVFDRDGGRIGYGGGFYDKFLGFLENKVPRENLCKMAVAYECQIISSGIISQEMHDISPDYIVTENSCIKIKNQ